MASESYEREARAAYDGIAHRAFENYLLELVKNWGLTHDRLKRERGGIEEEVRLLLDAKVKGEFPDTAIAIKFRSRNGDDGEEHWKDFGIWRDPTFFDDAFEPRCDPERMASDILMWFRGG